MRDFLIARREEVAKVTNLDFTFERQIELEREEAKNAGVAEGLSRGREEGLLRGREEVYWYSKFVTPCSNNIL